MTPVRRVDIDLHRLRESGFVTPDSPTQRVGGAPIEGRGYLHRFEVQEFRRPEFEVKAAASEGPFTIGSHATVTVSAAYYAGGALPGAELSWRVATTPASFRPPNRDDFVFGSFVHLAGAVHSMAGLASSGLGGRTFMLPLPIGM